MILILLKLNDGIFFWKCFIYMVLSSLHLFTSVSLPKRYPEVISVCNTPVKQTPPGSWLSTSARHRAPLRPCRPLESAARGHPVTKRDQVAEEEMATAAKRMQAMPLTTWLQWGNHDRRKQTHVNTVNKIREVWSTCSHTPTKEGIQYVCILKLQKLKWTSQSGPIWIVSKTMYLICTKWDLQFRFSSFKRLAYIHFSGTKALPLRPPAWWTRVGLPEHKGWTASSSSPHRFEACTLDLDFVQNIVNICKQKNSPFFWLPKGWVHANSQVQSLVSHPKLCSPSFFWQAAIHELTCKSKQVH